MSRRGSLTSLMNFTVIPLGLAGMVALTSCSLNWKLKSQPSSTLVIFVENLGFNAFSCGEDEDLTPGSGFQTFCEEAVRFTHAYTPSVMSQATIASILTAKAPREIGVRDNGASFVSSKEVTTAEVAHDRGLRTAFFSGGPPVFRRSGINQGFDLFDDSYNVTQNRLYRSAPDVVSLFLNWQEAESRARFSSYLYFADPQFIDVPTTDELGEIRESSYRSQIDVVGGALASLIKEMKRRKIWDETEIFLIGLNGNPADSRPKELAVTDLYSDATRTTLMIKPARKAREGAFNWKIDANVSLTDVGVTIFDLLGSPVPPARFQLPAAAVSLKSVLTGPEPDWPEDREVLSESGWASWRGFSGIRVALRKGPFLYLFDQHDRLYNTLTDNFEAMPLPRQEDLPASTRKTMAQFLTDLGYSAWAPPSDVEVNISSLGRDLWRARNPDRETLAALREAGKKNPENALIRRWRALIALRELNFKDLRALAGASFAPDSEQAAWAYVASRNLLGSEKVSLPRDPCFSFLATKNGGRFSKDCSSATVRNLADAANSSLPDVERTRAIESFTRSYAAEKLEEHVAEYNEVAGRVWDTPTRIEGPSDVELILALPEMKKLRALIHK